MTIAVDWDVKPQNNNNNNNFPLHYSIYHQNSENVFWDETGFQ